MAQKGLPPIHPGEYLTEILEDLGISQADFARSTGLSMEYLGSDLHSSLTIENKE